MSEQDEPQGVQSLVPQRTELVNQLDSEPEPTERVRESQWDTLALMLISAVPPDQCASRLGVKERSVTHLVNRNNPQFNQLWDSYRDKHNRVDAHHQDRMKDLAEDAYMAWKDAMEDRAGTLEERKLRFAAAAKWTDIMFPRDSAGTNLNLNLSTQSPAIQTEIKNVFVQLGERFPDLLSRALAQDPTRYVKDGRAVEPPEPIEIELTGESK